MRLHPFYNAERQLRNGWWIALFFLVLAALLIPALLLAQEAGTELSPLHQAAIVALASGVCQLGRRRPQRELWGRFDRRWLAQLGLGGLLGAALMLAPALLLGLGGSVVWSPNPAGFAAFPSLVLLGIWVAMAEELMFRGFFFQRLVAGLGPWPAQLLMAAYFLLTHLNNPGMAGTGKLLGSVNIFLASILFGLAYLRTGSLAMPLGLHFMANLTQGAVLGFGVSGTEQPGLLAPHFDSAPDWVTGGSFGLEASAPGLTFVVGAIVLLYRWQPRLPTPGAAAHPATQDAANRG
ncbi:CAAX amino terminal protease self- immunity [Lacunisphaera limnophila]|uniref:CAAX amino terminal protease self-immunity n=1 Tax=Lacunisphaera limnophila TaxID=1838286 RepID=A0A1D8AXI6_9BACT|nr:CPBP family intramembrane glutamic endopeptidase [Lacunisphaera limnophila]AOS45587.1 CAAX amino terminal protease self- immunity [Lacunisphaera limnophila]